MTDYNSFNEELLEKALKRYSEVQPPAGLEDRIITGVFARRARSRRRNFWWRTAGVAAAILVALALANFLKPRMGEERRQVSTTPPSEILSWVQELSVAADPRLSSVVFRREDEPIAPSPSGGFKNPSERPLDPESELGLTAASQVPALNLRLAETGGLVGSFAVDAITVSGLDDAFPE